MRALVYYGPGKKSWEEHSKPVLKESTDAIVKISRTTICGTDLHIMKGDMPGIASGRILGHEGVGIMKKLETRSVILKKATMCSFPV